ncbi:hypothetical protein PMAYCL1PPCAC_31150, partial [Pristionchus mayeri]
LVSSLVFHSFVASERVDLDPKNGKQESEEKAGIDDRTHTYERILTNADLEGSGQDAMDETQFDSKNMTDAEKDMEIFDKRLKRQAPMQATEMQAAPIPVEPQLVAGPFPAEPQLVADAMPVDPQIAAQAQRGGHHRDSSGSDERNGRHRPNRPSCRTARCTSGTECIIENGRPTCRPIRPQPSRSCRDISCPRDTRCRMERDPWCRDRNCSDQPVCVRDNSGPSCRNVQCPSGWRCRVQEEPGCRGHFCREVATCVNPCDSIRCPFGTVCRSDGFEPTCTPVVINQCLNARCPNGFQCRVVNGEARCFPVTGPQCRPNEVFTQCASPCEPSCEHASPQICPARCDPPRCQCAPGFWRHRTGSCVPREQCFFG